MNDRIRYVTGRFEQDAGFHFGQHALFLARAGSRAYNTFTHDSDYDYFGVVIPPTKRVLGLNPFESWEPKAGTLEHDLDLKVYGLAKAVRLLLKGNPNMLEVLWYPRSVYEFVSYEGKTLIEYRDIFSSKRAYKSLSGYAKAQFDAMLRGTEDRRQEWDYAVRLIQDAGWTVQMIVTDASRPMPDFKKLLTNHRALRGPGYMDKTGRALASACESIKSIHNGQFRQYMGEKRKQMVLKHGYDVKNASHLIRLLIMGRDFARTQSLFPWMEGDDRKIIMEIKRGEWTLAAVKEAATDLWNEAEEAFKATSLPDDPDTDAAEQLLIDLTKRRLT